MDTEDIKNKDQKQEGLEEIDRPVSIEGRFLGREVSEYPLWGHSEKAQQEGAAMIGNDAFTEIYFETLSGNVYEIYRTREGKWSLLDVRSNRGKKNEARGTHLSEEDLQKAILKVGEPFRYGKGGITTEITKITAVNGNRIYDKDWLAEYTGGQTSKIRERVRGIITSEEGRK